MALQDYQVWAFEFRRNGFDEMERHIQRERKSRK
jgi:hypothetical protein